MSNWLQLLRKQRANQLIFFLLLLENLAKCPCFKKLFGVYSCSLFNLAFWFIWTDVRLNNLKFTIATVAQVPKILWTKARQKYKECWKD